jgi:hypothetical protein
MKKRLKIYNEFDIWEDVLHLIVKSNTAMITKTNNIKITALSKYIRY